MTVPDPSRSAPAVAAPGGRPGKKLAAEVLGELGDDASLDDVLRALGFHRMVCRGLEQLAAGETVSHDELRRRLRSWPS